MAEPAATAKPQCGGGQEVGEYDLPLHVIGLCKCFSWSCWCDLVADDLEIVLVMGASIFGAGFPVAAKKIRWLKVPERVFFACKHFGTGVLIATAFVHVSRPPKHKLEKARKTSSNSQF
jgi:solute carrier family 39 (zinc transporter), member 1/2/3